MLKLTLCSFISDICGLIQEPECQGYVIQIMISRWCTLATAPSLNSPISWQIGYCTAQQISIEITVIMNERTTMDPIIKVFEHRLRTPPQTIKTPTQLYSSNEKDLNSTQPQPQPLPHVYSFVNWECHNLNLCPPTSVPHGSITSWTMTMTKVQPDEVQSHVLN